MNPATSRTLISQVVIGLTICAGGYMLFVEPGERDLAQVRAEMAHVQQEAARQSTSLMSISQAEAMKKTLFTMARSIATRNDAGQSEGTLFEAIMRLAASTGVRVDSMNPSAAGARPAAPATPGSQPKAADRRLAYTLNVQCEYDQLARFIEQLQTSLGYTDVRSIRISPSNEPGSRLISAQIETEHVYFDLSAIKSLAGAGVLTMKPIRSSSTIQRFLPAFALVAPVVAVQLLRTILGPGADAATSAAAQPAHPDQAAAAPAESAPAALTPELKQAITWLQSLDRKSAAVSPMDHPRALAIAPSPKDPIITPTEHPIPAGAPKPSSDITLGAIMGSSQGSLAAIGGRIFRAGESLETGWTVSAIDPKLQIVTLTGPGGATIQLKNEWKRRNDE